MRSTQNIRIQLPNGGKQQIDFSPQVQTIVPSDLSFEVSHLEGVGQVNLHKSPKLIIFRDVLDEQSCREIIEFGDPHLAPSIVMKDGGLQKDRNRTSWSCTLNSGSNEPLQRLQVLLSKLANIETPFVEPMQLIRYSPGQVFDYHLDTFGVDNPEVLPYNRRFTMVLYLNDIDEFDTGGTTYFPALGIKVRPCAGMVLMWENLHPSGKVNTQSLHQGEAPSFDKKYVLSTFVSDVAPKTAQVNNLENYSIPGPR